MKPRKPQHFSTVLEIPQGFQYRPAGKRNRARKPDISQESHPANLQAGANHLTDSPDASKERPRRNPYKRRPSQSAPDDVVQAQATSSGSSSASAGSGADALERQLPTGGVSVSSSRHSHSVKNGLELGPEFLDSINKLIQIRRSNYLSLNNLRPVKPNGLNDDRAGLAVLGTPKAMHQRISFGSNFVGLYKNISNFILKVFRFRRANI